MTIRQFFTPLTLGVLSLSCAWSQQYIINTYAGNRTAGFSGDGGAPTSAQLNLPLGLALDSSGNMYIADSVNQRIRKISGGNITTVAGNGTGGYTGDGAAATSAEMLNPSSVAVDSSGNLYIADTCNHVIRMVTPPAGHHQHHSRAPTPAVMPATAARPSMRSWSSPPAWPWISAATCTSPTPEIT